MKKHLQLIVIGLVMSINAHSQIDLDSGLVAAYSFSGNANDTTGNGFNGTVIGAALTTDRFNCPNKAYHFDEINNYIDLQNILDTVFAGTGSKFSISAWIKPDQIMTDNMIIAKDGDGGCTEDERQFYYRIFNENLNFSYNVDNLMASNGMRISGSTLITDTTAWYHTVITYDGTINTNNGLDRVKLYINGVAETTSLVQALPYGVTLGDLPSGAAHLGVGNYLDVNGNPCNKDNTNFFGKLDDLLIYDRVLTSADVKALYTIKGDTCSTTVTGIAANQPVAAISLYPNPANESITITTVQQGNYNFTITTLQGITLKTGSINGNIDVSALQKGAYIVIVNGDNGSVAQKLIKN